MRVVHQGKALHKRMYVSSYWILVDTTILRQYSITYVTKGVPRNLS